MQRLSVVMVHGSYSDTYRQEFAQLLSHIADLVDHTVLGVSLECAEVSATGAIAQFLQQHPHTTHLQILPLFLLPGVHVREDIPQAIAPLREQFPQVSISILDYLGKDARLAPFLTPQFQTAPTAQRILLAHGSRRAGANPEIAALAQSLHAHAAYWATEPSLATTVAELLPANPASICVVPYFLFSGKIPQAIATQIEELQQTFPHTQFHLGKPFGTAPECAQAIAQQLNRYQ
jgi:sirohydrochlorin cobaltochelatase